MHPDEGSEAGPGVSAIDLELEKALPKLPVLDGAKIPAASGEFSIAWG